MVKIRQFVSQAEQAGSTPVPRSRKSTAKAVLFSVKCGLASETHFVHEAAQLNFKFDKPCPFCVDMVKCVHTNEEATNGVGEDNMNFQFKYADKTRMGEILPVCFEILYANMSVIAPTGDSYEEDRRLWCDNVYPLMEKAERQLALLYCEEELAGYFQYSVQGHTLLMEEIQFKAVYHGTGMFRRFYAWLTEQLPKDLCYVAAYAHKNNQKSNDILKYLGLDCCGENKSGNSFYYKGPYRALLNKYGEQQ